VAHASPEKRLLINYHYCNFVHPATSLANFTFLG